MLAAITATQGTRQMAVQSGLFDVSAFTPHGFCLAWQPGLIWLQAVSDSAIALAYYSIPLALIVLVRRRGDLVYPWMFALFAAFILACGTTHVMGVLTLWKPLYWIDGWLKAATAALSVATALLLWPLLPQALALPSPSQLRRLNQQLAREIEEREAAASRLAESEARLRQAQKMQAVGQLTGGIAHDFNNMLTVVMANLELLTRRLPDDPRAVRLAEGAMVGAQRAARLTSQLLSFSRQQRLEPQALAPAAVIEGVRDLLTRTLGENCRLHVDGVAASGWPCFADRNQLESALLNLVLNACAAMPEGGEVRITAADRHVGAAELAATELQGEDAPEPGDYVVFSVTDTGLGMTEAVRRRAIEPFFTTRPQGQGTGLGLSQIYGFLRQSGGAMTIATTPGKGTRVDLLLPRASAAASVAESAAEMTPMAQRTAA